MRRIIREVDPPTPSSRLSTLEHETLRVVAEQRRCDPKGLGHQIKGDPDWIVMKALRKERSRRYESAAAFKDDIGHLFDEPVQRRPISRGLSLPQVCTTT